MAGGEASVDILFAVMPFADVGRPAIGVSLLDAGLKRRGFSSGVRYFNMDLAERIGPRIYGWFAQCTTDQELLNSVAPSEFLVGEWFFADLVFSEGIATEEEYIARFLAADPAVRKLIPEIREARRQRQAFVEGCVREIERQAPRVVGFTTKFHETCACLAVARRLKETANPPVIVFGGANCEGVMGLELIRAFPWIDYVCTGEGDEAVSLFLERLLRSGDARPVPGILKQGEAAALTSPAPVRDMDALPVPEYASYFEALRARPLLGSVRPRLQIEGSRGCWWGEKQHCTFCGLNGQTMAYRSKSAGRLLEELNYLAEAYGTKQIEFVDNIVDLKYITTLFPELARSGAKLEFFLETKSNLRFEQLRTLRDGGVRAIQPGIESFSNQALQLMRKGCTGLQNIQLLRWCEELGVAAFWNLLYGFPSEAPAEYARMAELVPLLTHLQPPGYCGRIHLDRFSPLFNAAEQSGVAKLRAAAAYGYVYPFERERLQNLAYFFEFDYADGREPDEYASELGKEVKRWPESNAGNRPRLDMFQTEAVALITDTRACAVRPAHVLSGLEARVYVACDTAQTAASLARMLDALEAEIRATLEGLVAAKLMAEMDEHYLSLAVMRNRAAREDAVRAVVERVSEAEAFVQLV
jgi:ribosomal peptide maturation radical SAM protein 1